jgi:hypothetical protein
MPRQRRYVESLSAYARQFLSLMEKPDVDHIEGCRLPSPSSRSPPPTTALDRRHHHRDLRLPAAAVRPGRRATLPDPRHSARGPDHQPDGGSGAAQPEGAKLMLLAPWCATARHQAAGEPGGPGLHPRPHRRRSVRSVGSSRAGAARSTPSRWWWTDSRCAMTWPCAWPNRSKRR